MKATKPISNELRREIALRAYYIWEREGRPEGRQAEHWALAEVEILNEAAADKPAASKKAAKKAPVENKAAPKPAAKAAAKAAVGEAKKAANGTVPVAVAAAKTKKTAKPKAGKSVPREH